MFIKKKWDEFWGFRDSYTNVQGTEFHVNDEVWCVYGTTSNYTKKLIWENPPHVSLILFRGKMVSSFKNCDKLTSIPSIFIEAIEEAFTYRDVDEQFYINHHLSMGEVYTEAQAKKIFQQRKIELQDEINKRLNLREDLTNLARLVNK